MVSKGGRKSDRHVGARVHTHDVPVVCAEERNSPERLG